jgi:hypothetical protein
MKTEEKDQNEEEVTLDTSVKHKEYRKVYEAFRYKREK